MEALWLFAALAFGIVILPGMDMAYVLASALSHGRSAGLAAVAGMVAGGAAHVVMGTLGVGLVLQLFPAAFNVVLAAGAAYVGWMGWSLWRSPATLGAAATSTPAGFAPTFLRATATCLLNPKAYLFMVAVFPQFLRPDQGPVLPQAIVLGAIIATAQALVYGGVAVGASGLRTTLARSASAQVMLSRGVAALLMAIAAWSLLQAWRS
jgi:threonine/homoserine/homoserine lactone efflux protein